MRFYKIIAQLDWQAGLNLNIPINTTEYLSELTSGSLHVTYHVLVNEILLRTPSPRPEESIFAAWSSPLLRRM
jgi:hypothetical protein